MIRLVNRYLSDPAPPRIRILDDLMRLILGGRGHKEGVGLTEYGIVVIDTDGTITKNDTLKVAYAGGDRFDISRFITKSDLLDVLRADGLVLLHTARADVAVVPRVPGAQCLRWRHAGSPLLGRPRLQQPHRVLCRSEAVDSASAERIDRSRSDPCRARGDAAAPGAHRIPEPEVQHAGY